MSRAVAHPSVMIAPTLTSAGIPHVIMNGIFVVRDGRLVKGVFPGRAVRNAAPTP